MEKKRHVVHGIVLLSIGVAFLVDIFTGEGYYWGPIILLGVGLGLVVKSLMQKEEERKAPVGGIILICLGAVSLIDAILGSNIVSASVKQVAPYVLPVLFIVLGVRILFR